MHVDNKSIHNYYVNNFQISSHNMEQTRRNTIRLIELYEKETCLWDIMSAEHKNSQTRFAFNSIAKVLGTNVDTIEKKIINNIRSQYFRELGKIQKSKSGSATESVYKPT